MIFCYRNEFYLIYFSSRFIPRRSDLDCDFALDMLVVQQSQAQFQDISNNIDQSTQQQQQLIRQQRRVQRSTNQQTNDKSAKKTRELLEYVMPQNRRIYNFGVKTLQPRPIGSINDKDFCSTE